MAPRISGQNYIFFMSLNSQKRLEYKFEYKKNTNKWKRLIVWKIFLASIYNLVDNI